MSQTPESEFKNQFDKLIVKTKHTRLFANPSGNAWVGRLLKHNGTSVSLAYARRMQFGLLSPGAPDRIGWKTITITENMVGQTIAQFCAVELKRPDGKGRISPEQIDAINLINSVGGLAVVIDNMEQAIDLFGEV